MWTTASHLANLFFMKGWGLRVLLLLNFTCLLNFACCCRRCRRNTNTNIAFIRRSNCSAWSTLVFRRSWYDPWAAPFSFEHVQACTGCSGHFIELWAISSCRLRCLLLLMLLDFNLLLARLHDLICTLVESRSSTIFLSFSSTTPCIWWIATRNNIATSTDDIIIGWSD